MAKENRDKCTCGARNPILDQPTLLLLWWFLNPTIEDINPIAVKTGIGESELTACIETMARHYRYNELIGFHNYATIQQDEAADSPWWTKNVINKYLKVLNYDTKIELEWVLNLSYEEVYKLCEKEKLIVYGNITRIIWKTDTTTRTIWLYDPRTFHREGFIITTFDEFRNTGLISHSFLKLERKE